MIRFINVSKTYESGVRALRDVSFNVDDGEFVFIAGRSGSGKSTLFRLLTRELVATEGSIIVNGTLLRNIRRSAIPAYRRTLGVVYQDFRLLKDRTVYENIAFAQRVIGVPGREIDRNVSEMMELTGISSKYKFMPDQLSGGEQQRVAIARALVNRPALILADEPTGNLDEANAMAILRLLEKINRSGTTVLTVTHSRKLMEAGEKRIILMDKGSITDDIPAGGREMRLQ